MNVQHELRVMTFNVRGSHFSSDGPNLWPLRAPLNVATIKRYNPDLIGFQEFQDGNLAIYQRELTEYDHFLGPQCIEEPPYCYAAIFWKRSRFECLDSGGFWLSPTPDVHSGGWDTRCFRSAAWVKLRSRESGKALLHVNTHLDHISEWARVEGAKLILRRLPGLREGTAAALVTADFNCDAGSDAYREFTSNGFTDTWTASGHGDGEDVYTFHRFHGVRQPDYGRIDWVLLSDPDGHFAADSCQIIRDQEPPVFPSDHFAVMATLRTETSV